MVWLSNCNVYQLQYVIRRYAWGFLFCTFILRLKNTVVLVNQIHIMLFHIQYLKLLAANVIVLLLSVFPNWGCTGDEVPFGIAASCCRESDYYKPQISQIKSIQMKLLKQTDGTLTSVSQSVQSWQLLLPPVSRKSIQPLQRGSVFQLVHLNTGVVAFVTFVSAWLALGRFTFDPSLCQFTQRNRM